MCGLAGVVCAGGVGPDLPQRLNKMIATLHHRGPDSTGFYHGDRAGLAHARLSIIDLEGGAQPVHNRDGSVQVVFNGEIFNYIELRQELVAQGHRFYTHSDTEVIVQLYERYGDQFVHHLNGQFAIALWDENKGKLILCRDRVGIAPLYYSEANGKLRGLGINCYIEACGIAPSNLVGQLGARAGLYDAATVRVNATGSISVMVGAHSHGQGHETTFAQLVAERFGVGLDTVAIVHGDTDKVQFGMGTYGSRSGAVGMSAIVKALDKVEAKAKRIAAHLLEASEGDIALEGGTFKVAGTDKELPFFQVALAAYTAHNLPADMEPGLKEGAFYDPTNFTFPAGTYVCEVEVDPDTGKVEIVDFVAADDFGTIINPMIVEGQVHGGLTQGIGQALLENASYDADGQLLSASYMDYTMPRADDVPSYRLMTTVTVCPGNPLGMKGCGEAGAIGSPPAVMNAITDAIGTNALEMPATPQAVWAALQAAPSRGQVG